MFTSGLHPDIKSDVLSFRPSDLNEATLELQPDPTLHTNTQIPRSRSSSPEQWETENGGSRRSGVDSDGVMFSDEAMVMVMVMVFADNSVVWVEEDGEGVGWVPHIGCYELEGCYLANFLHANLPRLRSRLLTWYQSRRRVDR
ncbi:hypothetical protein RND71_002165 [Anisodus tanguticus]|uniref:Uncharacterized protein n=1 Tax=Anisodus tanguticus TaxID=243964 RepID=A0AAE1VRQ3_9SOLA|nr:hypothetical protein RND71_002165 [Anisodus tanguticus]